MSMRSWRCIAPEPRQYPDLGLLNPGEVVESELDLATRFPGLFEVHKAEKAGDTKRRGLSPGGDE